MAIQEFQPFIFKKPGIFMLFEVSPTICPAYMYNFRWRNNPNAELQHLPLFPAEHQSLSHLVTAVFLVIWCTI